jgi:hypothetical protein
MSSPNLAAAARRIEDIPSDGGRTVDTLAGGILRIFVKISAIEGAQAVLERRIARLEKAGDVETASSDPLPLHRGRPPNLRKTGAARPRT